MQREGARAWRAVQGDRVGLAEVDNRDAERIDIVCLVHPGSWLIFDLRPLGRVSEVNDLVLLVAGEFGVVGAIDCETPG